MYIMSVVYIVIYCDDHDFIKDIGESLPLSKQEF